MGTMELAYFTGSWSEDERGAVTEAARLAEQDQPYDPFIARLGCPWACTSIEVSGRAYFMAHWARCPGTVFRAASAQALAAQIRAARQELPGMPHARHRPSA